MIRYLVTADGRRIDVGDGRLLTLAGTFYRSVGVLDTSSEIFDATTLVGPAVVETIAANAIAQGNDVDVSSGIIINTQVSNLNTFSEDALVATFGTGSTQTQPAEVQSQVFDALYLATGLNRLVGGMVLADAQANQAEARVTSRATYSTSFAESLAQAYNPTLIFSGVSNTLSNQAESIANVVGATASGVNTRIVSLNTIDVDSQSEDALSETTGTGRVSTVVVDSFTNLLDLTVAGVGDVSTQAIQADASTQILDMFLKIKAFLQAEVAEATANVIEGLGAGSGTIDLFVEPSNLWAYGLDATALLDGRVPGVIPQPIEFFKLQRASNNRSVTLTWRTGLDTKQVLVQRSVEHRSSMSTIRTLSASQQSVTITVDENENVSFRLVPIGFTGNRGKATYVVYSSPESNYDI